MTEGQEPLEPAVLDTDTGPTFPTLSQEMAGRMASYGVPVEVDGGQFLYRFGDKDVDVYLIRAGEVDILESDGRGGHRLVTTHRANQFTGELAQLSGRSALLCARTVVPTSAVRLSPNQFRHLISAEPDIGEVILRAMILRRADLKRQAAGNTVVIGSQDSHDSLRIQQFLTRNGYPHRFLDTDRDDEACAALSAFHFGPEALPAVILNGETVLRQPSNRDLAAAIGFSEHVMPSHVHDVAIVGAGPAGLAAAVYAASEGLDTIVIEALGPGGQAGTSSRIENYLGFPTGVSGQELADRAQTQAQKFGARMVVAETAVSLDCSGLPYRIGLLGGGVIAARSVVLACGARYRKLLLPELARYEGRGVHYAATSLEGRLCGGSDAVVVGGGNSAGQAAIFLSGLARHVHLVVRKGGLKATMSEYLITRIMESPRITLHPYTDITGLSGDGALTTVHWQSRGAPVTAHAARHLFLMIGAAPNTDWLTDCVALDDKGFVTTGYVHADQAAISQFSTSLPGVFAVGDVRSGSVKRVASSVGEGSVVVSAVHAWLGSLAARN